MKTIRRCILAFLLAATLAQAGVSLEWEYTLNGTSLGLPAGEFMIKSHKVAPSGHVALHLAYNDMATTTEDQRFVLLNPQGQQVWISDNLITIGVATAMSMDTFHIVHVSPDAAMFAKSDVVGGTVIHAYNKNADPMLNSFTLGAGESLAMNETDSAMIFTMRPPTSQFSPVAFYTVAGDPTFPDGSSALRKYRLDVVSAMPVMAQSVSGGDSTNFKMSWTTVANVQYQVQESVDLANWTNVGSLLTGTGATMWWSTPVTGTSKYFRVIQP